MISLSEIKLLRSLHQKKFRDHYGLFIAEGEKMAFEILHSGLEVEMICATPAWYGSNRNNTGKIAGKPVEINEKMMKRISCLAAPQEVLCVIRIPKYAISSEKWRDSWTIVLDGISDPGNLGNIIRIADWFGIRNIICSLHSVDVYNPKVIQATMGSFVRVKVHYTGLKAFFEEIKSKQSGIELPVYGCTLDGDDIRKTGFGKKGFIVFGSESTGVSDDLRKYFSGSITIPGAGKADSLNVAAAAAVICWEITRSL